MFKDRDFEIGGPLPSNAAQLIQDLDLGTLFTAMASDDEYLLKVSRIALLNTLSDPQEISYRQDVFADCLANPEVVRRVYGIAVGAARDQREMFWFTTKSSLSGMMSQSPQIIGMFLHHLKALRRLADEEIASFTSEGWSTLFKVLRSELSDEYFSVVEEHLQELKFKDGTLISATLGVANNGTDYVLRDPRNTKRRLRERLGVGGRTSYSFEVAPRDEAGHRAVREILDRGSNTAANSLTQAADHIADFFLMLRAELAFYVACLNLHDTLTLKGEPTCRADARPWDPATLRSTGLYDVCLSLRNESRVVGNEVEADGRSLVVVTGANSGGKSTFLRSVGIAHLMMGSGMFVPADSFRASVFVRLFTHFFREEDTTMTSGKLDEELARMSEIVGNVTSKCWVLLNESFSATNEREGSEIARQVIRALIDSNIRVVVVTHLYDLAHGFYAEPPSPTLFLRAERETDRGRTFKLQVGDPLPTSFGEDVYERMGGW